MAVHAHAYGVYVLPWPLEGADCCVTIHDKGSGERPRIDSDRQTDSSLAAG